jgi:uroporphyrinogen III methyltransferase / synthase
VERRVPEPATPLLGKRVLITRPAAQAAGLVHALERLGASCLLMPLVQIGEPKDWAPVDRALAALDEFQWLVFTSANGVHALLSRLRSLKGSLPDVKRLRLAAIGPGTAQTLQHYGLVAEIVPSAYRSEELAAALRPHVAGQRVLLARADRGRDILRQDLAAIATVEQIAVYSQTDVPEAEPTALAQLQRGEVDYVTVTSSSIAAALARALGDTGRQQLRSGRVQLVSISPVTTAVLTEEGLPVAREAAAYTMAGMVEALVALAGKEKP